MSESHVATAQRFPVGCLLASGRRALLNWIVIAGQRKFRAILEFGFKESLEEGVAAHQEEDNRRRFTEAVLGGVSAGVIGLDHKGTITLPNRSAALLLGLKIGALIEFGLNTGADIADFFNFDGLTFTSILLLLLVLLLLL